MRYVIEERITDSKDDRIINSRVLSVIKLKDLFPYRAGTDVGISI